MKPRPFILPYEPEYTGDREAKRRRKETAEWLRQRERELPTLMRSPALAPEEDEDHVAAGNTVRR